MIFLVTFFLFIIQFSKIIQYEKAIKILCPGVFLENFTPAQNVTVKIDASTIQQTLKGFGAITKELL